jgi:hypothetical protein
MTRYFGKDIPEMPVYIFGTPLKFEVLATEQEDLIVELDKCIQFGRGGVFPMTQEQYEEAAKKKQNGTTSESVYKQKQQRQELSALHPPPGPAADAAGIRFGGTLAMPQGREHTPHQQFGLPGKVAGPAPIKPMPDPIELPKVADLKPPTVKMSELKMG